MENATPYNWSPGYWRGRIIDNNLDKCCYILHSHLGHCGINVPGVYNQSFGFVFPVIILIAVVEARWIMETTTADYLEMKQRARQELETTQLPETWKLQVEQGEVRLWE